MSYTRFSVFSMQAYVSIKKDMLQELVLMFLRNLWVSPAHTSLQIKSIDSKWKYSYSSQIVCACLICVMYSCGCKMFLYV